MKQTKRITNGQSGLVHDLFIHSADENYVVARWCMANRLFTDFFWLAAHCLEKYLKAALLLNAHSAKGFGHDIERMFKVASEFAGDLFPNFLKQPDELNILHWHEKTMLEFIIHVARFGAPNNRYRMRGYLAQSQDLHMLDTTVFAIRRICCGLDIPAYTVPDKDFPVSTHRDFLINSPRYYPSLGAPLDVIVAEKKESSVRNTALNMNFSFAPCDFEHASLDNVYESSFSPLHVRIYYDLNSENSEVVEDALYTATWLSDNVDLGSDRKDISFDIEQAKKHLKFLQRKATEKL